MFEFLDLVTLGQRKKFFKTVLLVSLSDLFNFSSIFFICWIIYQMFSPWLDGSEPEGLAVAACAAAAFMLLSISSLFPDTVQPISTPTDRALQVDCSWRNISENCQPNSWQAWIRSGSAAA